MRSRALSRPSLVCLAWRAGPPPWSTRFSFAASWSSRSAYSPGLGSLPLTLALLGHHEVDKLLHGMQLSVLVELGLVAEVLLQEEHQIDDVERVQAEAGAERGLRLYFLRGHVEVGRENLAKLSEDFFSPHVRGL